MRKMYDYFGMALTPDTEAAMASYMNNDPKKTTYEVHKYSLQEFGLTLDEITEKFKEYMKIMSKTTMIEDII